MVVRPPEVLLTKCAPPDTDSENETLLKLKKGDLDGAATAHVNYVLDARDVIWLCNYKIENLKKYFDALNR